MKYLDVHRNGMTGLSFKIHFDPFTWETLCYPLESLWIPEDPEATKTAMQIFFALRPGVYLEI